MHWMTETLATPTSASPSPGKGANLQVPWANSEFISSQGLPMLGLVQISADSCCCTSTLNLTAKTRTCLGGWEPQKVHSGHIYKP